MARKNANLRERRGTGLTQEWLTYFWWNGSINNKFAQSRTPKDVAAMWHGHREEILAYYLKKSLEGKAEPGRRPDLFWDELREQGHRRQKVGTVTYQYVGGPVTDTTCESDYEFLKRLGLLRGYEKDLVDVKTEPRLCWEFEEFEEEENG